MKKRKEIENIIKNLDMEDVIRETWRCHNDYYGRTEFQIDCETGEYIIAMYTGGNYDKTPSVTIYTLSQNTIGNSSFQYCGDILDEDEYQKVLEIADELGTDDIELAMEKMGISFSERFEDYLYWVAENEAAVDILDWGDISDQLDWIYRDL